MNSCVICLTDAQPFIFVDSAAWKKCNIKPIIEKHFWWWHLKQLSPKASSYVCRQCWKQLLSFHSFYLRVEEAHRQYDSKKLSVLKECTKKDDAQLIGNLSEISNEKHTLSRPKAKESDFIICIANNNETIELLPSLEIDNHANNGPRNDRHTPEYKTYVSNTENNKYLAKSSHVLLCDICKIPLEDFTDIRNHYLKVHAITGYATCCRKKFYSRGQFADHLRVHENPFYFQCTVCTRILSHRVSYEKHKKTHKKLMQNGRTCGVCKNTFSKKDDYERHILSQCQEVNAKSIGENCDNAENDGPAINQESFTNDIGLNYLLSNTQNTEMPEHLPVVKSELIDNHSLENDQSNYINVAENTEMQDICSVVKLESGEIFNYTFIDENADCTNNETNPCESSVTAEKQLKTSKIKPNKMYCIICGKEFGSKPLLRRHENKMHHAEDTQKEHTCPFCSKVSPNKQSHRQHVRLNHTVGRVHACHICGKKFKFPSYLKDHVSTHTGIALHACPYCGRSFKSGANMYAHRKKAHPMEWHAERSKKLAAQHLKKLALSERETIKQ